MYGLRCTVLYCIYSVQRWPTVRSNNRRNTVPDRPWVGTRYCSLRIHYIQTTRSSRNAYITYYLLLHCFILWKLAKMLPGTRTNLVFHKFRTTHSTDSFRFLFASDFRKRDSAYRPANHCVSLLLKEPCRPPCPSLHSHHQLCLWYL